jgi:hypothetical protein
MAPAICIKIKGKQAAASAGVSEVFLCIEEWIKDLNLTEILCPDAFENGPEIHIFTTGDTQVERHLVASAVGLCFRCRITAYKQ